MASAEHDSFRFSEVMGGIISVRVASGDEQRVREGKAGGKGSNLAGPRFGDETSVELKSRHQLPGDIDAAVRAAIVDENQMEGLGLSRETRERHRQIAAFVVERQQDRPAIPVGRRDMKALG